MSEPVAVGSRALDAAPHVQTSSADSTSGTARTDVQAPPVSWKDVKGVQNLIERCLQKFMTQTEIIAALQVEANVDPSFTCLVWQKLEQQNPEFFFSYHARLKMRDQIVAFNYLVDQQVYLIRMASGGILPQGMPPQGIPPQGIQPGMVLHHPVAQHPGFPQGMPLPGPPPPPPPVMQGMHPAPEGHGEHRGPPQGPPLPMQHPVVGTAPPLAAPTYPHIPHAMQASSFPTSGPVHAPPAAPYLGPVVGASVAAATAAVAATTPAPDPAVTDREVPGILTSPVPPAASIEPGHTKTQSVTARVSPVVPPAMQQQQQHVTKWDSTAVGDVQSQAAAPQVAVAGLPANVETEAGTAAPAGGATAASASGSEAEEGNAGATVVEGGQS